MRILIIYEYYFDYIEDSQKVFEHPQYSENVQIKLRICRILRILEDPVDTFYNPPGQTLINIMNPHFICGSLLRNHEYF